MPTSRSSKARRVRAAVARTGSAVAAGGPHDEHRVAFWKELLAELLQQAATPGMEQRAVLAIRLIGERVLESKRGGAAEPIHAPGPRAPSAAGRIIDQTLSAVSGVSCEQLALRALVQAIVDNGHRMLYAGYRPDYSQFTNLWPEYVLTEHACTRAAEAWASVERGKRAAAWKPTAKALALCGLGYRSPETLQRECSAWIRRSGSRFAPRSARRPGAPSPYDTILATNRRVLEEINSFNLAMHRRIEAKLRRTPALLESVRKRLASPEFAPDYVPEWHELMDAGLDAVLELLTEDSTRAAALRFNSPFLELLTPQEQSDFRCRWRRRHPLAMS